MEVLGSAMAATRIPFRRRVDSSFTVAFLVLVLVVAMNFALYTQLPSHHDLMRLGPLLAQPAKNQTHQDYSSLRNEFEQRPTNFRTPIMVANVREVSSLSNGSTTATIIDQRLGVDHTLHILETRGVKQLELNAHKQLVPSWSQILDNYGGSDQAVILGLEQCEDYRKTTPLREIALGPAGLFSTGTNLLYQLIKANCQGPDQLAMVDSGPSNSI
jgi:hypothetical protein